MPIKIASLTKHNILPPIIAPPKLPNLPKEPFVSNFDREMKRLMNNRIPQTVYLNVYNVTSFNKFTEWIGFGFYHSSVEIYNHEFSYGGHDYDCSGIVVVEAGNTAGLTLKEKIPVGITFYNEDEIDDIIINFGDFWYGVDYDPFGNNCNNFT